ncbi:MAG: hypothetical protein HFI37_02780 [Lachnospiraceae bacterium]|nr:hypothetical protein [Lachnospiraceae bacterium]
MRLEDLKKDFPKMPSEIRERIEREVERQMKVIRPLKKKSVAAAATVAVLLFGTTVCAGTIVYQMNREEVGKYGIKTKVEKNEASSDNKNKKVTNIPLVSMEVNYLPEGMRDLGDGKYGFEGSEHLGGVSMVLYRMDTGDDSFEMLDQNVQKSENIDVGGRKGVYLELHKNGGKNLSFNQRIYLFFPEVHHILEMYIAEDVKKEEALKIAEGINLKPDKNAKMIAENWSSHIGGTKEAEKEAGEGEEICLEISKDDLKGIYQIGDTMKVSSGQGALDVKVTDVQILDNIEVLKKENLDEAFEKETDEKGNLLPATIRYMKKGDGVNTLDEKISSKEVAQKLVYVTVEYQNNTEKNMKNILYSGSLLSMEKKDAGYAIYQGEQPKEGDTWDTVIKDSLIDWGGEMIYCDVLGGEEQKNYIDSLKVGEKKTVHLGIVVDEEQLKYSYLNLCGDGYTSEFSEAVLKTGLVDIQQKK